MTRLTHGRQRWAIFISGRGSNLQAVLDETSLDVRLVVSSRATAPGLLRARRSGIPTLVLDKKINWTALNEKLKSLGITHVFLLGFMKIVPAEFISAWENRVLNVHPSLLPAYAGLQSIERSFQDGADMGVTVHVVTPEMDAGPALQRKKVLAAGGDRSWAQALNKISQTEQRLVREAVLRWR